MSEDQRPVPPSWNACAAEPLPAPTSSPALLAFGLTLFAWGLVSSLVLVFVGGALFFHSLLHWIGEIVHDAK